MSRRVVLPLPEGPMMSTISPFPTSSEISRTATTPVRPVPNRLLTFSAARAGLLTLALMPARPYRLEHAILAHLRKRIRPPNW